MIGTYVTTSRERRSMRRQDKQQRWLAQQAKDMLKEGFKDACLHGYPSTMRCLLCEPNK